jgi:hypothetical protein
VIKLSECGYPKRRLWLALKSIVTTLSDLVSEIAHHTIILAPCEYCDRSEAFITSLEPLDDGVRRYRCMNCSREIDVKIDVEPFGAP